jgi:hypothetical protein
MFKTKYIDLTGIYNLCNEQIRVKVGVINDGIQQNYVLSTCSADARYQI